ncbi:MAG: hypothetical protein R2699_06350 [Acidimicrobiales bacterium]
MTIEMQPRPSGKPTLSERIVRRLSELGPKHSRRSFFTRAAVAGSALAVNPLNYVLKPGTAYAQTTCGPGATCGEGWSVFCCTINNGQNACPPGSFVAGWWEDSSSYCGGGPRYIVDCNQMCGEPCTCYCPTGTCDNRRTCCNQFRYGQCHQEITCAGPVRCRMVMCVPPWQFDASCTTASATDNRTGEHNAPCNTSQPPPPPPPPVYPPPARANTWLAANADGRLELFHVGTDGAIWNRWQGTKNGGFTGNGRVGGRFPLGSEVVVGRNSDGRMEVFCVAANGNVHHMWQSTAGGGWSGVALARRMDREAPRHRPQRRRSSRAVRPGDQQPALPLLPALAERHVERLAAVDRRAARQPADGGAQRRRPHGGVRHRHRQPALAPVPGGPQRRLVDVAEPGRELQSRSGRRSRPMATGGCTWPWSAPTAPCGTSRRSSPTADGTP